MQQFIPPFGRGFWKSRMFWLMISLLLLLFLYPYFIMSVYGRMLLNLSVTLILVTSAYAVSDTRNHMIVALLLAIPAVAFRWSTFWFSSSKLVISADIFAALFYLYVTLIVLHKVFKENRVTADEIFGAVSAYLLFGLIWTSLYTIVYDFDPTAFMSVGVLEIPDFVYFSFVTLSTLGYGDIVPTTPVAQSLAFMEATIGVLYLTVMVARLVGLYSAQPKSKKQRKKS